MIQKIIKLPQTNNQVKQTLTHLKVYLQEIYQDELVKVILFGSRARGDHKPNSDIDILIVLKDNFNYSQEIKRTSNLIAELSLENDLVISRVFTTSENLDSEQSPFFCNVRKEGVVL